MAAAQGGVLLTVQAMADGWSEDRFRYWMKRHEGVATNVPLTLRREAQDAVDLGADVFRRPEWMTDTIWAALKGARGEAR
jgi:hypothetical protein